MGATGKSESQTAAAVTPNLLSGLNSKLEHVSYLSGYQLSADDSRIFDQLRLGLNGKELPSGYPHLIRWYRHVAILTNRATQPQSPQVQSSVYCTNC